MPYIDDEKAYKLAQFVPADERLKLIKIVFEACGENISKTAKEIGVTRAQIYRYLKRAERKDTPSDKIFSKVIIAAYRLRPAQTQDFFRFILRQMRELVSKL
ncbi:MAG: helix-turn-helix domain-containing protein [Candidatus Methanomethylicia archaeon]